MKKIAFLFLVLDNPNFPKIWNSYFRGHKDKYNIYIHPKYPEKCTWHKSNIIKELHPTAWGFITRAYMALLEEAFKDKDNYKFVTISESCVPIQTFDKFYEETINDPNSWIKNMKISRYNWEQRLLINANSKKILKNYARFCLSRNHVELLLKKKEELEFFHKMHVGDEFFLTVLYPLKNYKDFEVTYDDWDYKKKLGKEIKDKIRELYIIQEKNPKIDKSTNILKYKKEFNNISANPKSIINVEEDLEKIKKCSSFFYRKFPKDSNIEKYWKDIIKSH
jgi:hypothetical protein